jgi:hypothetical protein
MVRTFASCTWPASTDADPDGFTSIRVAAATGPGSGEASGEDFADRITGPCSTYQVSYDYGVQGQQLPLPHLDVAAGSIIRADGVVWTGGPLGFSRERGEVDILHNPTHVLTNVVCSAKMQNVDTQLRQGYVAAKDPLMAAATIFSDASEALPPNASDAEVQGVAKPFALALRTFDSALLGLPWPERYVADLDTLEEADGALLRDLDSAHTPSMLPALTGLDMVKASQATSALRADTGLPAPSGSP